MIKKAEYDKINELTLEWEKLANGFYNADKEFVNEFNDILKRTYFMSRRFSVNDFMLPEQFMQIIYKMRDYINEDTVGQTTNVHIQEYYATTKNVTSEFINWLCFGINMREAIDFCYYYIQLFLHYYDESGKAILGKAFPNLSFSYSAIEEVLDYIQQLKEKGTIFE